MAVVKLKYLRERPHLKRHLRYITHRRGREEGSLTRQLFDRNGLTDRRSVYELIDVARRGTVFYKFMINPDPKREDTYKDLDLAHITRQTILALERQLGLTLPFAAVLHPADHTPLRHVHGIFCCPEGSPKRHFARFGSLPGQRQPPRPDFSDAPEIASWTIPATAAFPCTAGIRHAYRLSANERVLG